MKIRAIPNSELPGSFVIESESAEEVLLLRAFCNDQRPIAILSFGDGAVAKSYSINIGHIDRKAPMEEEKK